MHPIWRRVADHVRALRDVLARPPVEFVHRQSRRGRLGVGWDFELTRGFSLATEFNYDIVDGGDDALVLGLTVAYGF